MKRWMIVPIDKLPSIHCEWHCAHLDDDLAFVGAANLDQHQIAALAEIPRITILPPIRSPSAIGQQIAALLTAFGVIETDTAYEAIEKVVTVSGLHQVGLGET